MESKHILMGKIQGKWIVDKSSAVNKKAAQERSLENSKETLETELWKIIDYNNYFVFSEPGIFITILCIDTPG